MPPLSPDEPVAPAEPLEPDESLELDEPRARDHLADAADRVPATPYRARPSADVGAGRYAPSPTSDLHLGNLRTAVLAWLFARSSDRAFLIRIEDLDQVRVAAAPAVARRQLDDLARLGLDHDGEIWRQSERDDVYAAAAAGLSTYECFCTRKDIAEASQAPHDGYRPYPGTCRDLSEAEREQRRRVRPAALRVRVPPGTTMTARDLLCGPITGTVDDFVIRRNDGTWAYNLAVVVDDLASGVDQVVRGDDLASSAPRQAWLAERLGGPAPQYAHVPLVLNAEGKRLAKRDGAVTLADLDLPPARVLGLLGHSLGLATAGESVDPATLLQRFDPAALPRTPWILAAGPDPLAGEN